MTPEQIKHVQDSFQRVAPLGDAVAEAFYERLFIIDPSLRPMFSGDMAEQARKLMSVLALVVNGLNRLEDLTPAVEALGRRHANYDVRAEHYDTVGQALLATLSQGLGDEFTIEVHEAWTAAYTLLATVMIDAAAQAEAA